MYKSEVKLRIKKTKKILTVSVTESNKIKSRSSSHRVLMNRKQFNYRHPTCFYFISYRPK